MPISKQPVAEFMNGKPVVLGKLVPCAVNTFIAFIPIINLVGAHALVQVMEKLRKGEEIGPTEVVNHLFDDLPNRILFLVPPFVILIGLGVAGMILGFIPMVGWILSSLLSLAVMVVLWAVTPFALIPVARDKTPWLEAWKSAFARVTSDTNAAIYMLLTTLLGSIGFCLCFLPGLATMPMALLAQLSGFDELAALPETAGAE